MTPLEKLTEKLDGIANDYLESSEAVGINTKMRIRVEYQGKAYKEIVQELKRLPPPDSEPVLLEQHIKDEFGGVITDYAKTIDVHRNQVDRYIKYGCMLFNGVIYQPKLNVYEQ